MSYAAGIESEERMDLNEARGLVERKLREKGVPAWEIYAQTSDVFSVEVKQGEVDSLKAARGQGLSVRTLREGRLGFAYSTSLEEGALAGMVESAVAGGEAVEADPLVAFAEPKPFPELDLVDGRLAETPRERKIAGAREMEKACLGFHPAIKRARTAAYRETAREVTIRNSLGLDASYKSTGTSASIVAVAEGAEGARTGWDFDFGRGFSDLDFEGVGLRAAEKARSLLGARKVKTVRCPVVLDHSAATELLDVLASSFLASNVQRGKSMLAGRVGEGVMSEAVTIVDDGLLDGGAATAPFDDEGAPTERTALVEAGKLSGFLYDLYTARKDGRASTGNASRAGIKGPPDVGTTNLFILPGERPMPELVKTAGRGVLLTEFLGIHTADPISGDFSVGAQGFWIEGGEIAYPVGGVAVAGNVLRMFAGVVEAGSDLRMFGSSGAPSLLVRELSISGD